MTKLEIKLIRHGEKKLFSPDPELTALGISQAEKLAQVLIKQEQSAKAKRLILSSPQKRTFQTANILAKELGLTVQVDDFLNIDNILSNTLTNKTKIIEHFQKYLNTINDDAIELLEILALTHSQNIKNYWRILDGPEKAIKDVYECGIWTIVVDGEKINFVWTEGDLNP